MLTGYILFIAAKSLFDKVKKHELKVGDVLSTFARTLFYAFIVVAPFLAFQYFGYQYDPFLLLTLDSTASLPLIHRAHGAINWFQVSTHMCNRPIGTLPRIDNLYFFQREPSDVLSISFLSNQIRFTLNLFLKLTSSGASVF